MENFFRPPPEVVALLIFKKFIYLQAIMVLAVIQSFLTTAMARKFAMLSLFSAALGVFFMFGPAVLGIYSGILPILASKYTLALSGLLPYGVASMLLLLSFQTQKRFGTWADRFHFVLIVCFLILWYLTV